MKYLTDKITWTEAMKSFAEEQVQLKLYCVADSLDLSEVKLTKINPGKVKVAVSVDSFRAQAVDEDFYIATTEAVNKIKSLIIKSAKKQTKNRKIKQSNPFDEIPDIIEVEEFKTPCITKDKTVNLTEISIAEAAANFEKTDYNFYIFKDIDRNGVVSILYHKFDDSYGVIRCK